MHLFLLLIGILCARAPHHGFKNVLKAQLNSCLVWFFQQRRHKCHGWLWLFYRKWFNIRNISWKYDFFFWKYCKNNIVKPIEQSYGTYSKIFKWDRLSVSALQVLKYRGPILHVTSPALGSNYLTLDHSATSIQILPEPALVEWHFFYEITTLPCSHEA